MAKPKRPPPPSEPRSFLLPIVGVVFAAFAAVAVPTFTAAHDEEPAPEEPAEEEEVNVTITVRTEPEGATVSIGGEDQGTTPCDIEFVAGEAVTLTISKEGFQEATHELTPEVGAEPIDVALDAADYLLVLEGVPEGTEVKVNDAEVEDPARVELGAELDGSVSVSVRARGYRPFVADVGPDAFEASDEGMRHTLTVDMERFGGVGGGRRGARPWQQR